MARLVCYRVLLPLISPRSLFALDELIESGVQRGGDAGALRFSGDSAAEKIHFGGEFVASVVEHGRRMIRLRANFVHRPRVIVKFYAEPRRHLLPFFDQRVQEVSKVAEVLFFGEMKTVRQFGERGDGID